MISGRSGLPKFRLLVTPIGTAPAQATLRAASATASIAPSFGSSSTKRPLASVEMASALPDSFTRTTGVP